MDLEKEIKIGSLVEVGPSFQSLYVVIHAGNPDPFFKDDPILYNIEEEFMAPMNRKHIKVLSE